MHGFSFNFGVTLPGKFILDTTKRCSLSKGLELQYRVNLRARVVFPSRQAGLAHSSLEGRKHAF